MHSVGQGLVCAVVDLAVQVQCCELAQQTLLGAHGMPAVSMRGCTDPTAG